MKRDTDNIYQDNNISIRDTKVQFNLLQAGRGIACLIVLLYHTNFVLGLHKYIGIDMFPIFNIGNCGIDFFFVLSGFVIYFAH